MGKFTHLHVHSTFSFLRGLASPHELVQAAAQHDMDALALTDHHGMSGAIEFYDACRSIGIQPILGLEVETSPSLDLPTAEAGVFVLLAEDLIGWRSLCRISSILGDHPSHLPFKTLTMEAHSLICLTGGPRSTLSRLMTSGLHQSAQRFLRELREIFKDRLFVEICLHDHQDESLARELVSLAEMVDIPYIAAHDIHYLTPDQGNLQRVLTAIRLNQPIDDLPPRSEAPQNAYFTSQAEMAQKFAAYPDALSAAEDVVQRCRLDLPLGKPQFPAIDLPPSQTALDVLRKQAEAGAIQNYGTLKPHIMDRLDHELIVIGECGYAALFLIVSDILAFARQQGVPLSSRGSAASSLVAYCLGITTPDPLRLNLYFERFLNPARATPPDIDTDLCSRRRESVIRYVYERFGEERVATVCTINRFRQRSALREVGKAYGLTPQQVNELTESLPHRWYGPSNRHDQCDDPYAPLKDRFHTPQHQSILKDAGALIDLPHHLSVHPGGMVISPGELTDLVPTQMAAKGLRITQFDLESIERLGMVKIDLLGTRGLSVLGDVAEAVSVSEKNAAQDKQTKGRQTPSLDFIDSIPESDPEVSAMIHQGRTIGCFAIESPGMRATLRELHAENIDDIMAALALYRPGPLVGGSKAEYVRRHRKIEAPSFLHPALEPVLNDTFGVMLYQEQVLRVAHELAGLSLVDADLLRRAMSHFDPGKQMQNLKEKFIAGAFERSRVPEEIGERIWQLMAAFAGYGFPKAHAASYALVAWRSAWCKQHYPALFMAAVLANWGGYYSQRVYITEARRMGLKLRTPHINQASREFSVRFLENEPVLFMGLNQVHELTQRTQKRIIRSRPFNSLQDFLTRVDPRPAEVENLIKISALEGFGSIPGMLEQVKHSGWQGGQLPLFTTSVEDAEDWSIGEKAAAQESLLGVSLIAHPLELSAQAITDQGAVTTQQAAERLGQRLRVAGMRQTWRRSRTSHGEYIYFMGLEDLEGMLGVIISAEVYHRCRSTIKGSGPYIIEGVLEMDDRQSEPVLRAERVWSITPKVNAV